MIRCLWGLVLVAVLLVPAATLAKEGTLEDYKLIIRNGKAVSEVSIRQLEKKLPQHTITTATPWQKKAYSYTGPLIEDVLNYLNIKKEIVTISALDGYGVQLSTSLLIEQNSIFAIRRDGRPMDIEDKGPIRIIFNFDGRVGQKYYLNKFWIWMISEIRAE